MDVISACGTRVEMRHRIATRQAGRIGACGMSQGRECLAPIVPQPRVPEVARSFQRKMALALSRVRSPGHRLMGRAVTPEAR